MIREVVDKETGAILFKKDKETQNIEYLLDEVAKLKKYTSRLEKRIRSLEEGKESD